jgi:SAM-dependent methyltransferase
MDPRDWDERYRTDELVWRAEPNRFLVEEVEHMPPGRALDLACGEGRNALWLAAQGWEVTAVDFSAVGLAKARRLAIERGIRANFVAADVLTWDPPARAFDLVIVMYLHLLSEDRRRTLLRAVTALAPGGTLLVVGHDSTNLSEGTGGPQDPRVLMSPKEVAADLDGLEIVRAERVRRPVSTEQGGRVAIDTIVRARLPERADLP